ncbi:hypothetical protein EDB87DRAFT_1588208 [Lactarius vividus]|nr:hypothetical protein EDB87DRAFT_1588208 [Lactarius vividus]
MQSRRSTRVHDVAARLFLLLPGLYIGAHDNLGRRWRREGHDTERGAQAARLDDDGGVEPVSRWVVREPEPGCRERLHGVAEVGVVADSESEEVGGVGCSWGWRCLEGERVEVEFVEGVGIPHHWLP